MSINCAICISENVQSGVKCEKCNNNVCLDCEIELQKCPFCRTPMPSWLKRLATLPKSMNFRLYKLFENTQKDSNRFGKNERLFMSLLNRAITDPKLNFFDEIEKTFSLASEDDYIDILQITKKCLHMLIMNGYPDDLITFFELVIEYIQSEISTEALCSGLGLSSEDVDEWITEFTDSQLKSFNENIKFGRRIENFYKEKNKRKWIYCSKKKVNRMRVNKYNNFQ